MSSGIIPDTYEARINYLLSKVAPWTTNAVAIGTTSGAVTSMNSRITTTQTKLAAAVAAREASKNATAELQDAFRALGDAGADIVKQVRAKAATDGNSVYFLAQIPAPATPTPVAAPGTPSDFVATLKADGSLEMAWRCANPAGAVGTMYQLSRRVGATGAFAAIGNSGTRTFLDTTLPAGVACVTYQIVAARSTAIGSPAQFLVNFGCVGGEAIASVASAPKLAA